MDFNWNVGMRFRPTDEELIRDYLWVRLNNGRICVGVIMELNIYNYEPSNLQDIGINHDGKMYFFTPVQKKHEEGSRINRLTKGGYWKASQSTSPILSKDGQQIGTKRPLVYYYNQPNIKSVKTEWLMNEYMIGRHSLVLCEIHYKKSKSNSNSHYLNSNTASNPNPQLVMQEKSPYPELDISWGELCELLEDGDEGEKTNSNPMKDELMEFSKDEDEVENEAKVDANFSDSQTAEREWTTEDIEKLLFED